MTVLLLLSALVLVLLHLRQSKYRAHFAHDVRSHAPPLLEMGRSVEVTLAPNGFRWPEDLSPADTVLLDLELESRLLGRFVDPEITLGDGLHSARQYFERAVRGRRYLNITPVLAGDPEPGTWIPLAARHVRFRSEARLCFFQTALPDGPALVIAPHPDDAEIAAFGLYSSRDAWVVTISAGEVGTIDFGGVFEETSEGARLRGATRVGESIVAPATIGGVPWRQAMNLGYFDGALEAMHRSKGEPVRSLGADTGDIRVFRRLNVSDQIPDSSGACTWNALVGDLAALLDRSRARLVVAPHPAYDRHPDHRYVGLAVMEAIARSSIDDGLLLLYVVHPPGHRAGAPIHPVGARDGMVSLPPLGQDAPEMFDSIYSHALTEQQRVRKLLALDTFRDIRPDPRLPPSTLGEALHRSLQAFYRYLVVYDGTIVRKAVRPNELFFAVPFRRCAELLTELER